MEDLTHPTNQEVIEEYGLKTFDDAVSLSAHLLWVLAHTQADLKRNRDERLSLGKQLAKEQVVKDYGLDTFDDAVSLCKHLVDRS